MTDFVNQCFVNPCIEAVKDNEPCPLSCVVQCSWRCFYAEDRPVHLIMASIKLIRNPVFKPEAEDVQSAELSLFDGLI